MAMSTSHLAFPSYILRKVNKEKTEMALKMKKQQGWAHEKEERTAASQEAAHARTAFFLQALKLSTTLSCWVGLLFPLVGSLCLVLLVVVMMHHSHAAGLQ